MTRDELDPIYKTLFGSDAEPNHFITNEILEKMLGRSADVAIPMLEHVHDAASAGASHPGLSVLPVPPDDDGQCWFKAIRLDAEQDGGPVFVAVLELANKPNPVLDEILERAMEARFPDTLQARRKVRSPGPAAELKVFNLGSDEVADVQQAIDCAVADRWTQMEALSTGVSYDVGDRWSQRISKVSSSGIAAFGLIFSRIRRAIEVTGQNETMVAIAKDVAQRNYGHRELPDDLRSYALAAEVADTAVRADGYMAGPVCEQTMRLIQTMQAERAIPAVIAAMDAVAEHNDNPYLFENGIFVCNDLNDSVGMDQDGNVSIQDQSSQVTLTKTDGRFLAEGVRRHVWDEPGPLRAEFEQTPDGWRLTGDYPFDTIGAIKMWNSSVVYRSQSIRDSMMAELRYLEANPGVGPR